MSYSIYAQSSIYNTNKHAMSPTEHTIPSKFEFITAQVLEVQVNHGRLKQNRILG